MFKDKHQPATVVTEKFDFDFDILPNLTSAAKSPQNSTLTWEFGRIHTALGAA